MKYFALIAATAALSACNVALPNGNGNGGGAGALGGAAAGGGLTERLVLGSRMSFEQCQARGGLIIRDAGSPMVACDPRVQGPKIPENEFDHPQDRQVAAAAGPQG